MPDCPTCGEQNPDRAKFCLECGTPLAEPAILPGTEERKVVTVLFCDLVGFTSRSDRADPEDVRATIRPYHSLVRTEIEGYGGTVEKFIGDAVMAVFGAPIAHEDDAERAVRCALTILEAMEELNETHPGFDLSVRIGINTGEAVVALSARPELGEGIVTGDVVNTASRLQSIAPTGGVVVGEATFLVTKDVFDYEALEPVDVKGKAEPVPLWRALAARARFGTDLTRRHAVALVGREVERGILQGLFERAVRGRAVQLVTIVGEPGVGKSRMVLELGTYIDEYPDLVVWRQGRCLPYGEGITFWALGEIVKNQAGILESDTPDQAAAKLDRVIRVPEGEREWFRARLAPLVGAEGGAAADREEAFTAWRRFIESLVADRAGVFVFEDLHWADPAMLQFLEHVAEWAEGVPMLLVCTARPELYEKHPNWAGGKRNATTISLDPLTDEETARLIAELLDRAVLPVEVQSAILERAGGNPLYAEEFVRMLKDRGTLVQRGPTWGLSDTGEIAAPEGIHALIAARLDTLPPDRKALLRDAAVVGKVFWAGAVATMGGRDEREVRDVLHELTRKELVRPLRDSSMAAEAEYTFWHMLVRDVAYQQIPRAERAVGHRAAAAWIESQAGDRVEDLAEVLAHHYLQALELTQASGDDSGDLTDRTLRYLLLAADRAAGLDLDRAAGLLTHALALAPQGHPERASVLERWGKTAQQVELLSDAVDALREAVDLYGSTGRVTDAGRAMVRLANAERALGGPATERTLAEAITVLEAEPPGPELVDAYAERALTEYTRGSDPEAIRWAERALALAEQVGAPEVIQALGVLGGARSALGDPRGLADMRRAIELGLARGESQSTARLYNNLGVELFVASGPAEALEVLRAGVGFARQRGLRAAETLGRGSTLQPMLEGGAWDEAAEEMRALRATPMWEHDVGIRLIVIPCEIRLSAERGLNRYALEVAEGAEEAARDFGEPQMMVEVFASVAAVRARVGEHGAALKLIREIVGAPSILNAWNYVLFVPLLVRTAIDLDLAVARDLFKHIEPSSPAHIRALLPAQAAIAEAEGNVEEACRFFAEAIEHLSPEGWIYEESMARLGQGRCLVSLGLDAQEPLHLARSFFARVGAAPLLKETGALLERGFALGS